jgi:hypothetical protein
MESFVRLVAIKTWMDQRRRSRSGGRRIDGQSAACAISDCHNGKANSMVLNGHDMPGL